MPPMSSPMTSHSPVWIPARTRIPSVRARRLDVLGAADGPGGSVERGQEAVTGRLDLAAAVADQRLAHRAVVGVEQLVPAAVAELSRRARGVDDVGEEDAGQHAVRLGTDRVPVRNSSISPSVVSGSSYQGTWSPPSSSTSRASGRCSASQRPLRTLTRWSWRRWSTSAGTWTLGTTSRTSVSRNIVTSEPSIPGLALARSRRAKKARVSALSDWLGAATSMIAPVPQCGAISSAPASSSASTGNCHG